LGGGESILEEVKGYLSFKLLLHIDERETNYRVILRKLANWTIAAVFSLGATGD